MNGRHIAYFINYEQVYHSKPKQSYEYEERKPHIYSSLVAGRSSSSKEEGTELIAYERYIEDVMIQQHSSGNI